MLFQSIKTKTQRSGNLATGQSGEMLAARWLFCCCPSYRFSEESTSVTLTTIQLPFAGETEQSQPEKVLRRDAHLARNPSIFWGLMMMRHHHDAP